MALVFVYTLVVFLLASVVFFTHSLKKEASIILKGAPEMVVQRMVAGRHDLIPLRYIEKIKEIRGSQSRSEAGSGDTITIRSSEPITR